MKKEKEIPYSSFGTQGETIHFAHANAYPPETYLSLLNALSADFKIQAIHHRPLWPDAKINEVNSWYQFSDDLIQFFDQQKLKNVHGFGHSLGAVASIIAASERKDLFKSLFLIDPVLFGPSFKFVRYLPKALIKQILPIAKLALKRKDQWKEEDELFESYREKAIFRRYADRDIRQFFRGGTEFKDGLYHLRYTKEWEAHTYSTATYVLDRLKSINIPVTILRASETDVISHEIWMKLKTSSSNINCIDIDDASHLLPFEYPKEIALHLKKHIDVYS